jgi:coenzyme F420 hydrogenase subunit beta
MDGAEILAIGLFCMESFHYDGLIRKYFPERGIDVNSVTSFRIKKGRFIASGPDGELLKVKLRELDEYVRGSCKLCTDFAAEFADISVGDVGSEDGWSTVLVRTELGEKVVERLIASGRVEVQELSEDDLTPAAKLAQRKKEKHAKKEG